MNVSLLIELYLGIGIVYTLVNGLYRKLDTDSDWGLPFLWMFLWWVCFIALFIQYIGKKINKF